MDRLKRDIDTTLRDQPNAVKLMFYLMAARVAIAQGGNTVEYDLHKITSDYLIRNIVTNVTEIIISYLYN